MSPEQARAFRDSVLNIVSQIPRGRVTTYGHIAALAGWPSHSRMVGRTLRYTPGAEKLPCHRVVNKEGRTQGQRTCGYGAASMGAANGITPLFERHFAGTRSSIFSYVYQHFFVRVGLSIRRYDKNFYLIMGTS